MQQPLSAAQWIAIYEIALRHLKEESLAKSLVLDIEKTLFLPTSR